MDQRLAFQEICRTLDHALRTPLGTARAVERELGASEQSRDLSHALDSISRIAELLRILGWTSLLDQRPEEMAISLAVQYLRVNGLSSVVRRESGRVVIGEPSGAAFGKFNVDRLSRIDEVLLLGAELFSGPIKVAYAADGIRAIFLEVLPPP